MARNNIRTLDLFDLRKVEFCPDHFVKTNVRRSYNMDKAICEWIEDNLNGRYYFGLNVDLVENQLTPVYTIGFEQAKELSFFMLACPHLKYS